MRQKKLLREAGHEVIERNLLPEDLSEEQALRLMVADPLLIRRPLMQVGERYETGFDPARVDAWIGLDARTEIPQDLETCPRTQADRGL